MLQSANFPLPSLTPIDNRFCGDKPRETVVKRYFAHTEELDMKDIADKEIERK